MAPLGFLGYPQINPPKRRPRVKDTKILDPKCSPYFSWYKEAEKWLNKAKDHGVDGLERSFEILKVYKQIYYTVILGFPGGSDNKASASSVGDLG